MWVETRKFLLEEDEGERDSRKEEKEKETRCLSGGGVLSMHSAEKLNLNRGGGGGEVEDEEEHPWG